MHYLRGRFMTQGIKFSFVVLFAICLFVEANAQTLSVLEFGTNRPIPDVYVLSSDGAFGANTDSEGKLELNGLEGPFELTLQHPAYENETYSDQDLNQMGFVVYLSKSEQTLPTYTIRANRIREKYDEVTNDVDLIKPKDLQLQQPSNSADLLTASPKVYVQKSQLGGGSPVLRGFEANKVMLVVDGLKMNNAIYRSGHMQNVLTIDHDMIDQVEVIFGPGSLVYGSDALGGVMHFHTRDPQFGLKNDLLWKVNAHSQFASAYNGFDNHVDIGVGSERIAYLASFSVHQYDDLRIGTRRSHGDKDWGRRYQYVERINGEDVVIDSDDPEIMRQSGFTQYDLLQKLRVRLGEDLEWYTNMQYSTSTDIPRFDRLNDIDDDGLPKFAEWAYGPQRRLMVLSGLRSDKVTRLSNQMNLSLAYQQIEESRFNRRRGSTARTERLEALDIYTVNLDLNKELSEKHSLQYGAEFNYNDLTSTAIIKDIENETMTFPTATRYPDGDNFTSSLGAYVRHKWKLSDKLLFIDGIRLSNDRLASSFVSTEFFELPFDEISYSNLGFALNFGLNYQPKEGHSIVASLGSGYRSPNIDDVGKTFDFEPGKVVIPSPNMKPEYALSADLTYTLSNSEKLDLEVSTYFTAFVNLIRRQKIRIDGMDSILFEGEQMETFSNQNVDEARILGFSVFADYHFNPKFGLSGQVNYTNGQEIGDRFPLGHIPPTFGKFKAYYNYEKWFVALTNEWNAEKPIERYSQSSEDKASEALASGTPSWMLWHINAQCKVNEHWRFNAGVENILDEHYKPFSSGISGAGRNFKFGVALSF